MVAPEKLRKQTQRLGDLRVASRNTLNWCEPRIRITRSHILYIWDVVERLENFVPHNAWGFEVIVLFNFDFGCNHANIYDGTVFNAWLTWLG